MASGSSSASPSTSNELQCVGRLEIVRPKPVGFLCGSLPVPTDKAFHHNDFNSSYALVPSSTETVKAPRYRMIPNETDLNNPALVPNLPDKVLPVAAINARNTSGGGDLHWEGNVIDQNLARKCETLAVSGLAEYGDEIDVVAPVDILKQIFKMPYSKARLSIAVHRIGQTLVLNTGPDIEEGEKLIRRHNSQSKHGDGGDESVRRHNNSQSKHGDGGDESLFLNFAKHSVRVEACDCPPPPTKHATSEEGSNSSILPGNYETKSSFLSDEPPSQASTSSFCGHRGSVSRKEEVSRHTEYPQVNQVNHDEFWESKQNKKNDRRDAVKKASQVGEKSRSSVHESEKYRRAGNDSFMRVLFWQFHNFRMLLGSDLLLFSNEKYVSVSLHLWDVTRQVTPLTWLEAWLDNTMASVPELAICYHENGVVQGYELLKTDDIFLLKGISEDGTPAFHPQVVQQNGLSVLRFLQENCKQDPGAYWLYKNSGEDVIQLFDLSVIPKSHSTEDHEASTSILPSLRHRGRRGSLFSLGTLLYRLAHRLSFSMVPNNRAKCARLFKKCFDFLDEHDHLVVRALAHEQFARLILKCYQEMDFTSEFVLPGSELSVTDVESTELSRGTSEPVLHDKSLSQVAEKKPSNNGANLNGEGSISEIASVDITEETSIPCLSKFLSAEGAEMRDQEGALAGFSHEDTLNVLDTPPDRMERVADSISSKLAAIHHVCQAIKSLRWKRQLQKTEEEFVDHGKKRRDRSPPVNFSVCTCGDADCIEVCDIKEWLPKSKMDRKLWKLVLLLGESYLALGQAYKDDGQLHQALKVVDLACSVYGSMPKRLGDAKFISSMISCFSTQAKFNYKNTKTSLFLDNVTEPEDCFTIDQFHGTYLFWAKAWTLVGDVYIEYQMIIGEEKSIQPERTSIRSELKISSEVEKELKRLEKELGQSQQNCSSCSLINCSCQSDRANSGNSASSSSGGASCLAHARKPKRSNTKNSLHQNIEIPSEDYPHQDVENTNGVDSENKSTRENHARVTDPNIDKVGSATSDINGRPLVSKGKTGGIFRFLEDLRVGDAKNNLSAAVSCYDAAWKALSELPTASSELESVVKKKGWVCNELGRYWLNRNDLDNAELAFADAIKAFKEVSDYTNIILINCNLGHGRRALAEEMVSKMENLNTRALLQNAYNRALEVAKLEYSESLRYYGAAKLELNSSEEAGVSVKLSSLKIDVYTQFAHTYLRLGMLLAKEDITAEVYENGSLEDLSLGYINPCDKRAKKELRKHEISANDALREALSIYEALGEVRKQEAAYAYFQLACYHRDCCLKFLRQIEVSGSESGFLQKVKQYASLAERNWQKSVDFYGPKTHPFMFLTILIERSSLSWKLSESLHSNAMLESALSRLLEGRHVFGEQPPDLSTKNYAEVNAKFRNQLQAILKRMLHIALSISSSKSSTHQETQTNNKSGDAAKFKQLYGMSLKLPDLSQLQTMYELWIS